jgi:glyoxylase-like metal-dependent hydrolase (beta-lactamase superfamily II)
MTAPRIHLCLGLAATVLLCVAARVQPLHGQSNRDIGTSVKTAVAGMRVLQVRENVFMLSGAGGNITVLRFPQGLLVVDTGSHQMADKVLAVLRELSSRPVAHIINTTGDDDHVGGNEKLAISGKRIPRDVIQADNSGTGEGPMIVAREEVLTRMSESPKPPPFRAWPTDVFRLPTKKLSAHLRGGEPVQLVHVPAAHTNGDILVWFRRSDLIMTGDVFSTTSYPVIDVKRGGTINGEIEALNTILDLAFPFSRAEGGTMIVPGHGRLADFADVAYYRDMVTMVRDRVRAMVDKGMTLQQVKAERPTLDYDPRYGSTTGPSTTDMFVEAVYATVSQKP